MTSTYTDQVAVQRKLTNGLPSQMNGSRRLSVALLASVSVHAALLLATAVFPDRYAPQQRSASGVIQAVLLAPHWSLAAPAKPSGDRRPTSARSANPLDQGPPLESPPKMMTLPDWSELEMLPLPGHIKMHFRMSISATGRVEKIDLIESSPLPKGISKIAENALNKVRYAPARALGKAVRGKTDVVVEAGPETEVHRIEPASAAHD